MMTLEALLSLLKSNPDQLDKMISEDSELINNAVEEHFNSPNDLLNLEGCDPEHPVTQAAIAINTEMQDRLDTLLADTEGCNIWSGDYD